MNLCCWDKRGKSLKLTAPAEFLRQWLMSRFWFSRYHYRDPAVTVSTRLWMTAAFATCPFACRATISRGSLWPDRAKHARTNQPSLSSHLPHTSMAQTTFAVVLISPVGFISFYICPCLRLFGHHPYSARRPRPLRHSWTTCAVACAPSPCALRQIKGRYYPSTTSSLFNSIFSQLSR